MPPTITSASAAPSEFRRTLNQSWITLGIILAAAGLQYVVSYRLVGWLRPTDYGDYEVAMAVSSFLLILALHGSDKSLFKYLPGYMSSKDWGHYAGFLRFHLSIALGLALTMAVVGTVLALAGAPGLFRPEAGLHEYHPLILALWVLPIAVLGNVLDKLPRMVHRMAWSLLPLQVVLPLVMLITMWVMTRAGVQLIDWYAIGAYGLSYILVVLIQCVILRLLPSGQAEHKYQPRVWLGSSLPMLVTSALIIAMTQVDLLMLEWIGTEGDVGVFGFASRTAFFMIMAAVAVKAVMAPMLADAADTEDAVHRGAILRLGATLVFWPGALLFTALMLFGRPLLASIAPAYERGYLPILVLAATYLIDGVVGFPRELVLFTSAKRIVVIVLSAALALNIALNAALIPEFGVDGSAVASGIATVGAAIAMAVVGWTRWRILPIPIPQRARSTQPGS